MKRKQNCVDLIKGNNELIYEKGIIWVDLIKGNIWVDLRIK